MILSDEGVCEIKLMSRRSHVTRHMMSEASPRALAPVHRMRQRRHSSLYLTTSSGAEVPGVVQRTDVPFPPPRCERDHHPGRWGERSRPESDICWASVGFKRVAVSSDLFEAVVCLMRRARSARPFGEDVAGRIVDFPVELVGMVAFERTRDKANAVDCRQCCAQGDVLFAAWW